MGLSMSRTYLQFEGDAEAAASLVVSALAASGFDVVDGSRIDVVKRRVSVWQVPGWLVVEDEDMQVPGELAGAMSGHGRALSVDVYDDDLGTVGRYEAQRELGRLFVGSLPHPPNRLARFEDLLASDGAAERVGRALKDKDTLAHRLVGVVLAEIGVEWDPFVADESVQLVVSDGTPAKLELDTDESTLVRDSMSFRHALHGVAGDQLLTVPDLFCFRNGGQALSEVEVSFSGTAIDDGLVEVDRMTWVIKTGRMGPAIETDLAKGRSLVRIVEAEERGGIDAAANEEWHRSFGTRIGVGFHGKFLRPGTGVIEATMAATNGRSATATWSSPVIVLNPEVAPARRPSTPDPTGSGWDGLSALAGQQCWIASMQLVESPAAEAAIAVAFDRWVRLVASRSAPERFTVTGVKGVRTLKVGDIGSKSWPRKVASIAASRSFEVGLGEFEHGQVLQRFADPPVRSVFQAVRTAGAQIAVEVGAGDRSDVLRELIETTDAMVDAGCVAQASIALADHAIGLAACSRYEWAIGHSHRKIGERGHWLAEPGQVVYLPAPLMQRIEGTVAPDTYERRHVGSLTSLASIHPRLLHDLERDFDPILRPAASPRT